LKVSIACVVSFDEEMENGQFYLKGTFVSWIKFPQKPVALNVRIGIISSNINQKRKLA